MLWPITGLVSQDDQAGACMTVGQRAGQLESLSEM